MEFLGIGINELVFIVIIALIVLGPKDMQKAGRTIGKWMRNIITSDGWKVFQQTSRELRTLPNRLMREANDEMNQINNEMNKAVNRPASLTGPVRSQPLNSAPAATPENRIEPPKTAPQKEEDDHNTDA
jgi:sec-independent protein translocase protein TatB